MPTTYTYTGSSETHDVSDADVVRFTLDGAGGEGGENGEYHSGGGGGTGGFAEVDADVSDVDTVNLWVGGGNGTRWGRSNGGSGGDAEGSNAGDGGNGAGSTEVRTAGGDLIAVAEGGGGGGGASSLDDADEWGGGGGGGARGGNGGYSGGNSGGNAQGSGDGGDGGDSGSDPSQSGTNRDGENGSSGGATVNGTYATDGGTTSTGGGNNADGEITVEVLTYSLPDVPQNLSVDATRETEIDLSWDASDNAEEYRLYRHDASDPYNNGSQVATITDDGSTSYSHTDTDLSSGKQYYYQVTAYSTDGGESDPSSEVTGTTEPFVVETYASPAETSATVTTEGTISGTVVDGDTPVQGAKIYVIDDSEETLLGSTTTDSNGEYSIQAPLGHVVHVCVQYEDGDGNYRNDESKPFVVSSDG